MTSAFLSKKFLVKFIAVVTSVVLVLCFAPLTDVFETVTNVSAAETPVYDPNLGTYTESNGVLTATAYEGAAFRGWFNKEGREVSYSKTFTIPSGTSASDYIPVFYNLNLIKNGGFEAYNNGVKLSADSIPADEQWNGVCYDDGTWADNVKVTTDAARTGTKSILLNSFHHCTYKHIDNLKPNTQYTLTYYFNMVPTGESDFLQQSFIVDGSVGSVDPKDVFKRTENPYYSKQILDSVSGACAAGEWKKVTHTFYTGDTTSVKLLIFYKNEPVNNVRPPMYVDDVTLVEDVLASPGAYYDEDFSMSVASWTPKSGSVSRYLSEDGRCYINATAGGQLVHSAPFLAKKGGKYTVKLDFNTAELTQTGNYINFSLTTVKGEHFGYYVQKYKDSNDFKAIVKQGSKTLDITEYYEDGKFSNTCIQHSALKNFDVNNDLTIELSFKATENTPVYLNVWINLTGTYSIDNLSVTEDVSHLDSTYMAANYSVATSGTAIRTEGIQGLRYKTRIDKKLLTEDMYYGLRVTEYGTLAIKTAYCGNGELTIDGVYDYGDKSYGPKTGVAYSFENGINKIFEEENSSIEFTGVLTNIREENYNTDYTVRAYFKYVDENGKTGVFYGNQADVAIYPVSKAAYSAKKSNGEYKETEEVRNYLYNNIISEYTDKILRISNNTPKYSNFQGIRSTVYHGTSFFPDSHNRTYTEAQAATEMDRLVDTKVDNVRTRFDSNWAWTESGWNWDSEKMTAFYKWGKMLQDRDISITIQAGWHLYDFICFYNKQFNTGIFDSQDPSGKGHSSIPEVNYLHGYNDAATEKVSAKYGEDANADKIKTDATALGLSLNTNELEHYSVAAARYGEWIKQGMNALKAHGVNNVEYIIPFTESGDFRSDDEIYSYDEWIIMTIGLQNALKNADLRSSVKIIGPAQSLYASQNRLSLVEYVYDKIGNNDEYKNMIDINAMHQYSTPNTAAGYDSTIYDPEACYSMAESNFTYYNDVLTNSGLRNQEFWCDEYFAHAPDSKWWNNVGMQMTQFAAGMTAGINNGVNRFLTWQMFDCLWDSDAIQGCGVLDNSSEFSGGIHAVGTCSSLVHVDGKVCPNGPTCPCTAYYNISSYTPRVTYYGINLIGKYLNNENADVFEVDVIDDADNKNAIYASAIKNDDGDNVVIVVNTTEYVTNVDLQFESGNVKPLTRYTYDPSQITPTVEAISISSDKTISGEDSSFIDTIPAQSFVIYVESNIIGDDVNIPWFN